MLVCVIAINKWIVQGKRDNGDGSHSQADWATVCDAAPYLFHEPEEIMKVIHLSLSSNVSVQAEATCRR